MWPVEDVAKGVGRKWLVGHFLRRGECPLKLFLGGFDVLVVQRAMLVMVVRCREVVEDRLLVHDVPRGVPVVRRPDICVGPICVGAVREDVSFFWVCRLRDGLEAVEGALQERPELAMRVVESRLDRRVGARVFVWWSIL